VDSTPDNILDDRLCAYDRSFSVVFRVIISTRGNTSTLHREVTFIVLYLENNFTGIILTHLHTKT
jgi:hypothetical protein